MLTLIDLSNNNPEPVDFGTVKREGAFGVWLKVSEGRNFADALYAPRAERARAARLHVGGYHFARPVAGQAVAEAAYFCRLLGKVGRRDLHPVLDLEKNDDHLSSTALYQWVKQFETTVHNLTGVRCLLYSGPAFLASLDWSERPGTGAGLWVAAYGPDDGHDHEVTAPAPWRSYVAHQYTSRGVIAGVSGYVDLSHAHSRRKLLAHGVRGLV